jgi:DNA invertase Pin-like site-specific DNA recombinase
MRQGDEGLDEHQRRIKGAAMTEGWPIGEMFIDEGVSGNGAFGERPAGRRLCDKLECGDAVICAQTSHGGNYTDGEQCHYD